MLMIIEFSVKKGGKIMHSVKDIRKYLEKLGADKENIDSLAFLTDMWFQKWYNEKLISEECKINQEGEILYPDMKESVGIFAFTKSEMQAVEAVYSVYKNRNKQELGTEILRIVEK